ncbi:FKBP-type peptidyl-prolyl cis-trans isomerase [Massilia sp. Dwa41.01b]|uniref:FKBP-type peptidyl-prolyl cis-trans isomerase n=1 Tax=unclassified Massilia TaxID=2609279 RepID=UPI001600BAC6|nr:MULTISPECIES: FKBP-type peptidyl-prolyl cis-trans isomerase [unclassified Massilia]QNA89783.1 FKBP-type peptidyl-prolyl cis-trans isomerase [Massilia sp. Dwa41.01b]QNB00677.1 FKBP-type peptidyl-prolyl cis-trans isomerase [Massilia sp. Se16.2.3]
MKHAFLGLGLILGLGLAGGAIAVTKPATATATKAPAANAQGLRKIDTVVGKGKEAVAGKTVTVNYTGYLYAPKSPKGHGPQFDTSVGNAPFTFPLGMGTVIKGWDQGVVGMKVGGKRTLIIPAELGYGARGAGPIPPNSNLIFDVELLDVQ